MAGTNGRKTVKRHIAIYDMHYPKVHWPTLDAVLDFLEQVPVDGITMGGDQFDFECISHHTKGKPLYRIRGAYRKDIEGFNCDVLDPLESRLPKGIPKIWHIGNHERFEHDLIEEQPELEGQIDHVQQLALVKRGWKVIPLAHASAIGKLKVIHGEVLTGIGNQAGMYPSRKAVELYAGNVLAGHTHSPQQFTRVSPVEQSQKWQGTIAPILGAANPTYLRNRPHAWANGFVLVELHPDGNFNLNSIIVTGGRFAYGGKLYGR